MIKTEPPVTNWTDISEFPKYEISPLGEVRDIDTHILVRPAVFDNDAYVELMREGKPYLNKVSRLVKITFPTVSES